MGNISEALGGTFDTRDHDPATGFDPIPAGWYPVLIENAELAETKKKDGKLIALELTIVGDKYANRKLWPRLNIENPSVKAQEFGRRELSAIVLACGLVACDDTSELIGETIMAKVAIRQEEGREPDNEVKGYKAVDGTVPAAAPEKPATQTAKPTPTAPPAAATKPAAGKRPWERK